MVVLQTKFFGADGTVLMLDPEMTSDVDRDRRAVEAGITPPVNGVDSPAADQSCT